MSDRLKVLRPHDVQWLGFGLALGLGVTDALKHSPLWLLLPVLALVVIALHNDREDAWQRERAVRDTEVSR